MTIHRTWHTLININNMKFSSLFRVCLFSHIRFCELQKASGITPWKKYHSLLASPAYYRMCSTDVYCSKQTGSSSTKGNHAPIIYFVLELGRRKLSMQPKFVRRHEKMLLKNRNQRRSIKWICSDAAAEHCRRRVCIAHNNYECHRYGQLYLHTH